ncbi:DNA-packaging protein [Paenibacillus pinisoli]|uniref:DNA-packaging protein n=1 Tax=Paenibacillus pinisoli TaxID=1276110 RepID=A0A3A6PI44_9BACL|nr:DNA-packaging protein [Paenibacillus pinisoli]RJX40877.1 DNA-packaging protein [Paenibacillus pinisoli]
MIAAKDVWEIVKLRLDLTDDSRKPLIDTYIAEIEHRIKHYCNIRRLPDGLLYVWASMVVDAVRVDLPHVDEIDDTVGGQSANVKVGDTSVSGSGGGGLTNTAKTGIDQVVFNYKADLNRYRRLGWGP